MKKLSLTGMMEATRLTRAGRLPEAASLLRSVLLDRPQGGGTAPTGAIPLPGPSGTAARARRPFAGAGAKAPFGASATPVVPVPPGAQFLEHSYADENGERSYKLYVPSRPDAAMPLVVMLHGCTQSPDDFAAGTRMNELAEEHRLLVAYPAQSRAANASKCWNWFNVADQQRGGGEPALIAGITRQIMRDHPVDPRRVYVAGLSAGGAAAAVLGAAYPDLYAGIGIHSGLACGAARDVPSAFAAMKQGAAGAPRRVAAQAIRTIVFHGDKDGTVNPINGEQVLAQFGGSGGRDRDVTQGRTPDGTAFTRIVESSPQGRPMLEHWLIHGAGHAWSGGSQSGSYTDPRGPDASREMLRFFLQAEAGPGAR